MSKVNRNEPKRSKASESRCTRFEWDAIFPDDAACLDYLVRKLYPEGIYCPKCAKVTKHHREAGRPSFECQYCGHRAESIDHVVPRSRGGQHIWENVVAACRRCNTVKRDRYLHETSMRLRVSPAAPRHLSWVTVLVDRVPELWEPYLGDAAAMSA